MLGVCVAMLGMRIYRGALTSTSSLHLMGTKGKDPACCQLREANGKARGRYLPGWGYNWEQKHRALTHEIFKRNADEIYPELLAAFLKIIGEFDKNQIKGHPIG